MSKHCEVNLRRDDFANLAIIHAVACEKKNYYFLLDVEVDLILFWHTGPFLQIIIIKAQNIS